MCELNKNGKQVVSLWFDLNGEPLEPKLCEELANQLETTELGEWE